VPHPFLHRDQIRTLLPRSTLQRVGRERSSPPVQDGVLGFEDEVGCHLEHNSLRSVTSIFNSSATCGTAWYLRNASGSVVGFSGRTGTPSGGFVLHPDGVAAPVNVPAQSPQSCADNGTFPDGINAEGTIAGWYVSSTDNCTTANTGVDPPEGQKTTATSINDGGAIAGYYQYKAGGGPPLGFIRVP